MLLQELRRLSLDPAVAPELPREGYAPRRVRWVIRLDSIGDLVGVTDLAEGQKFAPKMQVPERVRTRGVRALLLTDNAKYVFGMTADDGDEDRAEECRRAFAALVDRCARETGQPEVEAVSEFLRRAETPERLDEDLEDVTDRITFAVDDVVVHELPEVAEFWERLVRGESTRQPMQCLVCGEWRPPVVPWPVPIKGIPGGQMSGNALASANAAAFESYGWDRTENSAACYDCAAGVGRALNWLLGSQQHHLRTSPNSVAVFWSRPAASADVARLLGDPDAEQVRDLLLSPFTRDLEADPGDDRFYLAHLASSGARVAFKGSMDAALPEVRERLASWFRAQSIVMANGAAPEPVSIRALALAPTRDGRDEEAIHPQLPGHLLRVALEGQQVQPWILALAVGAVRRSPGYLNHSRAALLKLALLRDTPDHLKEEYMQRLDLDDPRPAYRLGRLLVQLDQVQAGAFKTRRSGADRTHRYYGAASTAPATVFPALIADAQHHMRVLQRERFGWYVALDRALQELLEPLTGFPVTLTLEEQGLFALGYYHQRAANRLAAEARRAAKKSNQGAQDGADQEEN